MNDPDGVSSILNYARSADSNDVDGVPLVVRVERACRRTDLFERRRQLMEEWAELLTGPAAER